MALKGRYLDGMNVGERHKSTERVVHCREEKQNDCEQSMELAYCSTIDEEKTRD